MSTTTHTPAPLSDDALLVGTVLADYRLVRFLAGAEGDSLYEGLDPTGGAVGVRLVGRKPEDQFERFLAVWSSIEHPHLLRVLETGETADGRLYVVSEFSAAPTLAEVLAWRLPAPDVTLRLLGQVADALDAGHDRDLVHPGLAPEAILVEQRHGGHAVVTEVAGYTPETEVSSHYRSPEALRGEMLTAASDVHALTCILLECLTRSRRMEDLPPDLRRVIEVGTATDPAERFSSCSGLVAAAGEALDREPFVPADVERDTTVDPWSRAHAAALRKEGRRVGSHSVRNFLLALGIGAALGGGVAIASGDDPAPGPSGAEPAASNVLMERAAVVRSATPALERLVAGRTVGRRRLSRAGRPAGQAVAAAGMGRVYSTAARELDDAGAKRLALAARRGAVAHSRLAAAARRGNRRRWRAAVRAVRRTDSSLKSAVRAFRSPRS